MQYFRPSRKKTTVDLAAAQHLSARAVTQILMTAVIRRETSIINLTDLHGSLWTECFLRKHRHVAKRQNFQQDKELLQEMGSAEVYHGNK
jgi:hypothetical protein